MGSNYSPASHFCYRIKMSFNVVDCNSCAKFPIRGHACLVHACCVVTNPQSQTRRRLYHPPHCEVCTGWAQEAEQGVLQARTNLRNLILHLRAKFANSTGHHFQRDEIFLEREMAERYLNLMAPGRRPSSREGHTSCATPSRTTGTYVIHIPTTSQ